MLISSINLSVLVKVEITILLAVVTFGLITPEMFNDKETGLDL